MLTVLIFQVCCYLVALLILLFIKKENYFFENMVEAIKCSFALHFALAIIFYPTFVLSTRNQAQNALVTEGQYSVLESFEGEAVFFNGNELTLIDENDYQFTVDAIRYQDVEKIKIGEKVKLEKRSSQNFWFVPLTSCVVLE